MIRKVILTVSGTLILLILIFSFNAHALKFEGDSWVAHHYGKGGAPQEYLFVIDTMGIEIDPKSFKLKDLSLKESEKVFDFADLTEKESLLWFEIEDFENSKLYSKLLKQDKIEEHLFDFSFRSIEGKNYVGNAAFATFHNPTTAPEPATILLLGSGLIGLAGYSLKKSKKK